MDIVQKLFDIRTQKIARMIEDIESWTCSSCNRAVWKIMYASIADCSKLDLRKFKVELRKAIGYFRCYDIFPNGLDKIHVIVYPTKQNMPIRSQERNKQRAAAHAAAPG